MNSPSLLYKKARGQGVEQKLKSQQLISEKHNLTKLH